jgi:hypothetical protein
MWRLLHVIRIGALTTSAAPASSPARDRTAPGIDRRSRPTCASGNRFEREPAQIRELGVAMFGLLGDGVSAAAVAGLADERQRRADQIGQDDGAGAGIRDGPRPSKPQAWPLASFGGDASEEPTADDLGVGGGRPAEFYHARVRTGSLLRRAPAQKPPSMVGTKGTERDLHSTPRLPAPGSRGPGPPRIDSETALFVSLTHHTSRENKKMPGGPAPHISSSRQWRQIAARCAHGAGAKA